MESMNASLEDGSSCVPQSDGPESSKACGGADIDGVGVGSIEAPADLVKEEAELSSNAALAHKPGYARIKQEFLVRDYKPTLRAEFVNPEIRDKLKLAEKDAAGGDVVNSDNDDDDNISMSSESEPPQKKAKLKGRNQHRPKHERAQDKDKICPSIKDNRECKFGARCKFSHDLQDFMTKKLPELPGPCYTYDVYGFCPYGISCRFAKNHMTNELENLKNEELIKEAKNLKFVNELSYEVRNQLWKKKYNFKKSDIVVKNMQKACKNGDTQVQHGSTDSLKDEKSQEGGSEVTCEVSQPAAESMTTNSLDTTAINGVRTTGCVTDEEVIRKRPTEIKKIDFTSKLYLAPLTTVGNLPFRRICKGFGADITCGEMALVTQLLKGKQSEWSLVKRHPSEDIFGVQICGSYPDTMTRCAQLLKETCQLDFIDINCGCPIDLIYRKGSGSALLGKVSKLEQICSCMTQVMEDMPLTVKLRTGVFDNKNVAHTILPRLRDAGVSLVTVHGRSREQRYTKLADWEYISQCAKAASPMPVFGNGDILSYEEMDLHLKNHSVSGAMIARGALIKPWIFTEIKESRHWDISANERLDILRKFSNYGLEHWGSDSQGVENTRRFLLEWLSFSHRYIPVGVLEQAPQRINERPPYYVGRNDLETMMASASCADWIKISEMLLGPVPTNFQFLPKHKANAYQ